MAPRSRARIATLSAAGALLVACTDGSATVSTPATSSTTPSVEKPVERASRQAQLAYVAMWSDFADAGTNSDWQSPRLAQHATATALTTLTKGLFADHNNGLVSKGQATHSPKTSSAEPSEDPVKVVVTDCSDSSKALKYRSDNGKLADDTPGGRRLINAVVDRQPDSSWKVTDFGVHEVGSC